MNTQQQIITNESNNKSDNKYLKKQENLEPEHRNKPYLSHEIPFILIHVMPFAAFWTGATAFDWSLCIALYFIRMFFVTGGYHRYFSHRTYKTSRVFQFILAFMAQTSAQKGILWWAAHHRVHHKYSDQPHDPHSMKIYGFWYSHLGWILGPDYNATEFDLVKDLTKYPELRWLNTYHLVPPFILAIVCMALGAWYNAGSPWLLFSHGWSTLWIGFFFSTVLLYHGTFSINSIMHKFGKARYLTGDESKNSWWLAFISMGEGWHNNHHYYQSATRQGFFWWEYDFTYYVLRFLALTGIIWGIREVPDHVKYSEKHLIKNN
jgi:stearoyl-CoA desaturase (delta-9 desaturase)